MLRSFLSIARGGSRVGLTSTELATSYSAIYRFFSHSNTARPIPHTSSTSTSIVPAPKRISFFPHRTTHSLGIRSHPTFQPSISILEPWPPRWSSTRARHYHRLPPNRLKALLNVHLQEDQQRHLLLNRSSSSSVNRGSASAAEGVDGGGSGASPQVGKGTGTGTGGGGEGKEVPFDPAHLSGLPRYIRRLVKNMPALRGRKITKDDLLSLPLNFFERLRIRFKWFTIRGFRRYRADDWSAFLSWILGGVSIWLIIGTTSFVSFLFFLVNSLQLQEYIARILGKYLTSSSGVTVIFESAIVPKFGLRDSRIVFKNVYVSRGEVREDFRNEWERRGWEERKAITGGGGGGVSGRTDGEKNVIEAPFSPLEEGEGRAGMIGTDTDHSDPSRRSHGEKGEVRKPNENNYTKFHLSIDTIEVSLSLYRWLDGKGLVKTAVVKGVRGVVDRSHVKHDPDAVKDRTAYRQKPSQGDFFLEGLDVEDFLVTMYQPDDFRPYTFSVFNASIPQLRKQWLFFDLLSADLITGQVDNCLFSLHKPQSIGRTAVEDLSDTSWKRMSRFRVDGVPVDHLQSTRDTGPLSWITSGKVDMVADIRFPREPEDDVDLSSMIMENLKGTFDEAIGARIPGQPELRKPALEAPKRLSVTEGVETAIEGGEEGTEETSRKVDISLDIRFKDVKAAVPIFNDSLSYTNSALVRPIVAFINANRTLIPVRCRVQLDLSEFDGSWTFYDTGLLDLISEQVYEALAHHVQSQAENSKRFKTVGYWSLQVTANALLNTFRQTMPH